MNYTESIEYIHSIPKFRRPLGNAKLAELLEKLGNPQRGMKFIHIAGTNGKGSVAAMTAQILQCAGYKTGLYTSPFIEVFNERIRVNGENIPYSRLAEYVSRVRNTMDASGAYVSEFAFVTAVAFAYFRDEGCDFVVLEAGMGGRLDATNVIDESVVSVICKIALDHTAYLGDTLEEIAGEKCGIIRNNGTVISYPNEQVRGVIEKYGYEKKAHVTFVKRAKRTKDGFIYGGKQYALSLDGEFQAQNAAAVCEIVSALCEKGFEITDEAVRRGFANVSWKARFERAAPDVIIDGAHNCDGMRALRKSLEQLGCRVTLVMAMMEDKACSECMREIAPAADKIFVCELDMPRCIKAEALADMAENTEVIKNPHDALKAARKQCGSGVVCVCGSLYLAGELRADAME